MVEQATAFGSRGGIFAFDFCMDHVRNVLMPVKRRSTQRRSLLRPEKGGGRRLSYWKALLIANGGIAVGITLVSFLRGGSNITSSAHILSIGISVLYSTCITTLAYLLTTAVRRRGERLAPTLRVGLLAIGWLSSGALGSLAAYGIISLATGGRISYPTSWIMPILVSNGVLTIGIGTFLLVYEGTRQRLKERAALLDQGDLLTAEFRAARAVQERLLPEASPRLFGYDINGVTEPAVEIGGDYFDYLTFADGAKGILVADAAGKGIPAALVMAKFQGMAQALSIHVADPIEFFVGLNDTLRIRLDRRSFITVGMLTIDFHDRCAFYRAGHNPMLLFRSATGDVEALRPEGIALGLSHGNFLHERLRAGRFSMDSGDVALLYSDGLVEATDARGMFFGDQRLIDALRHAARTHADALAIRHDIAASLRAFVNGAEPADDVTIVVVRKVGKES